MKNNWLRKTIRSFEPYVVPEIREHTVINANESPYNIFDFPKVKEDFLARLAKTPSYHYPDPFAEELRAALAKYVGCKADEVLVGNGGDEIISLIMNTFLDPGDTLLTHTPTFDIYGIDAEVLGAKVITVPDLDGYRRDRDAFLAKIKEVQPKVTVLCNPNNPTGELLPLDYVEALLKAADNLVVIDEAYLEFAGAPSIITKLSEYDNLIVIRTLSKAFGLAGCRVGYGVAQKEVIDALGLTKLVYNLNILSQDAALAAMDYADEILAHNVPPTIAARQRFCEALAEVPNLTVYPSATNFVLVRVPDGPAMVEALHRADICVRSYKAADLKNCLRITITTDDVAQKVAAVMKEEAAKDA
ncbi:histidinol-phosphate transaminase [uncultured Megasphaera sp.]|uniref:histidinol-phosphate transaminase n=1 Tax=uncultured Megasphaera sp. TaxID=165188 RepID=UPI0028685DF7|nr:histidinol-phosphate transaminase [uncultured Megasphaera sp.]